MQLISFSLSFYTVSISQQQTHSWLVGITSHFPHWHLYNELYQLQQGMNAVIQSLPVCIVPSLFNFGFVVIRLTRLARDRLEHIGQVGRLLLQMLASQTGYLSAMGVGALNLPKMAILRILCLLLCLCPRV